ncbi:MAG: hypothetical protein JWP81_4994 [Ferruginibacter sp.]|nr:hypothetical protein [Ferruginibacter sp.]
MSHGVRYQFVAKNFKNMEGIQHVYVYREDANRIVIIDA